MATADPKSSTMDDVQNTDPEGTVPEETQRSSRTLSEKGQDYFNVNYAKRQNQIHKVWMDIEAKMNSVSSANNTKDLQSIKADIKDIAAKHSSLCQDLIEFCERTKTVESIQASQTQSMVNNGCRIMIDSALCQIENKMKDFSYEQNSRRSKSKSSYSTSSYTSDRSSTLRLKAKAEAAKARLQFAEIEANIKKKQYMLDEQQALEAAKVKRERADLSVELELISQKRELAAAEAEAKTFEYGDVSSDMSEIDNTLNKLENADPVTRTQEYVEMHSNPEPCLPATEISQVNTDDNNNNMNVSNVILNPKAEEFYPHESTASDFTRYLLKKDMLLSRLTPFDDKPENYAVWKVSFKTVMKELGATPLEELDFLLKWTGPESKRHVMSIKAANISDVARGLKRAWDRLEERYGCPEMIEASIKSRIESFPVLTMKDSKRLYELSDLVSEIESMKLDERMTSLFGHYDSSTGVSPIVNKLPFNLREKWTTSAVKYMKEHNVHYPPFQHFSEFLREQSRIRNNPSFTYSSVSSTQNSKENVPTKGIKKQHVTVRKTESNDGPPESTNKSSVIRKCPIHHTDHALNKCRSFRLKPIQERLQFLKDKNICSRCCTSNLHDCKKTIYCKECNSDKHPTALHIDSNTPSQPQSLPSNGGEPNISTSCTRICKEFTGKSCAKILLANVSLSDEPNKVVRTYVMLDEQSDGHLASSELFDVLGISGEEVGYELTSCSGTVLTMGRRAHNIVVNSLDGLVEFTIPTVTECPNLPNNRHEIPTPEVAESYAHLRDIKCHIPAIDDNAQIMLLLGRDITQAYHVLDQRIGPGNSPYAQKLPLGWTIIGESCLGKMHLPDQLNVMKTNILPSGRSSLFEPCSNQFRIQDTTNLNKSEFLGRDIFIRTKDDDKQGLSMDDKEFLKIANSEFKKDEKGHWMCPLPFKRDRPKLQNNYALALKRARSLDYSLRKDSVKRDKFHEFMDKMLVSGHAEKAPPLEQNEEAWYLPIFGVYHPRKKDQLRIVFDSSAKYDGISLNDVLYSGPDLSNSLLGILLRFRREPVAIIADIEKMFYCFKVNVEHRNYLRFLWHQDNDLDKPLVDFRMCVHVFGNTASPAVATYGLRLTASQSSLGSDVIDFVSNDFYVDDGLTSLPTVEYAVDLLSRTQKVLKDKGNLRLHKIASNNEGVMQAFPQEDLSKDLKDLEFGQEILPVQRSLGVAWNLQSDAFVFRIEPLNQHFTRRGVLSTINSIFDPLGFLAPVVIKGKLLMRQLVNCTSNWDEPLPPQYATDWEQWTSSLSDLHQLQISRTYFTKSWANSGDKRVHVFADASEQAIAAVGYVVLQSSPEAKEISFVLGKAKVAPLHGHTIPRLELCAAVLAVEVANSIANHLDIKIENISFHTDSKVVLGYIHNSSRRFYTYVANRVEKIRTFTKPTQWRYVPTDRNPADQATRSVAAKDMHLSAWLCGPQFLLNDAAAQEEQFEMQNPDMDKEVRPEIRTSKTQIEVSSNQLGTSRFNRFSSWRKLVRAVMTLKRKARNVKGENDTSPVDAYEEAQDFILQTVQKEVYAREFHSLEEEKPIRKDSSVSSLSPFIDQQGMIRVGGRLNKTTYDTSQKNPLLIPGRHHIATLLVRHYHDETKHQGRQITEGAVRSAGLWITGGKRLISSILHLCVTCRKLRGKYAYQRMADLPTDRLEPSPPFTFVGVDAFGPLNVVTRRTRGGSASSKRWGIIFTCLVTRAIHIELVDSMSSSAFINSLRRFISIRGKVKIFRSDQGTNFVGALDDMCIDAINVDDAPVKEFLYHSGTKWIFNPPHASHMGGAWERMIGVVKKVLDSMLRGVSAQNLTHDVLSTFMAEACAIVNARPLVSVSSDPQCPFVLSPSMLLTQKLGDSTDCSDFRDLNLKDMYRSEWKRVQALAEMFWSRWKTEYLHSLQSRRKWKEDGPNIQLGDVVLLKDRDCVRNQWPMSVVIDVFPSEDDRVRKVKVKIVRDGKTSFFIRPVSEVVPLLSVY